MSDAVRNTAIPRITRPFTILALAFILGLAALVLLLGWFLGLETWVRIQPTYAAMVPSTALCFVAVSAVLLYRELAPLDNRAVKVTLRAVGAAVALVAAVDLVILIGGWAAGIDALLWPLSGDPAANMAPATALCFMLSAGCLVVLSLPGRKAWPLVIGASGALLVSLVAVVGYAFDVSALYAISIFTAMALHTAVSFVALTSVILALRPREGWIGLLFGPRSGSAGARRLFPIALLAPFVVCMSVLLVYRAGWIDIDFAMSLVTVVMTALLVVMIMRNAQIENRAERGLIETMDELERTLGERDLLLREVYHRVKNNLQQINALIYFEAAQISDPRAKDAFRATAGRIRALSTVHRLLISAPAISHIDLGVFLRELCEGIAASYSSADRKLTLKVEAAARDAQIDIAITLGLLVNELVTNAAKHAFTDRPPGTIRVRYAENAAGGARLVVSDDGRGMPSDEAGARKSAGTQIITSLVSQLKATMTVENQDGTTITVTIPPGFKERGHA